jgi:hypothetical protein
MSQVSALIRSAEMSPLLSNVGPNSGVQSPRRRGLISCVPDPTRRFGPSRQQQNHREQRPKAAEPSNSIREAQARSVVGRSRDAGCAIDAPTPTPRGRGTAPICRRTVPASALAAVRISVWNTMNPMPTAPLVAPASAMPTMSAAGAREHRRDGSEVLRIGLEKCRPRASPSMYPVKSRWIVGQLAF